jgi:hypothetical protein
MGAIGGSILGGVIGGAFGLSVLFAVSAVGYALGGLGAWRAIGRRRPAATPAAAGGTITERPPR